MFTLWCCLSISISVVRVRVCLTTVVVFVFIISTNFAGFTRVFFAFELTSWCAVVIFFPQWWHVGLVFSGFAWVACCVAVFIYSSSGAFRPFSNYSSWRSDTFRSSVSFFKCAWFIDFFRCRSILTYMNCPQISRASTPKWSIASFWCSSRKSINLWLAVLKTSSLILCFAVAIDWGFRYFLRNTVRISTKFSGCRCFWTLAARHHSWRSEKNLFRLLL